MPTLVINVVLALIGTIVSLFLEGSISVVETLLNNDLFRIDPNTNLLKAMSDTFSHLLTGVETIPIGSIMIYLGIFLTFVFTIVAVIESNISALEGDGAEPPFKILVRGVITLILILTICGVPTRTQGFFGSTGLLGVCGDMFSGVASDLLVGYKPGSAQAITFSLSLFSVAEQLVMLIFTFALFKGTIEAGVVYVERWLSYCLYICFLPVGIACNASKKMQGNCAQLMINVIAQLFTILVTIFGFRLYFNSLTNLAGIGTFRDTGMLLNYAIALACLSFVKNSEKIVNALGFKTIANGDTARDFARGSMEAARMVFMPVMRPIQRSAGKRVADAVTSSAYAGARRHLGENNIATKTLGLFNTKGANTEIKGAGIVGNDGRFREPTRLEQYSQGTSRGTKTIDKLLPNGDYAKFSRAMHNVNEALDNNTPINGKELALASGLSELDNWKTGDVAVKGQINGHDAILFNGSTVDLDGKESTPKTYAMVLDNEVLDKGTVTRGDASYTINSKAGAIPLSNGSGYIYEVNGELGNRSDYISNNVDSKYSSLISEYNQIKDEYSGSLNGYINDHPQSMFAHAEKGDDIYAQFENAADKYDRAKAANASVFNEISSANPNNADMAWKSRANERLFEMFEKPKNNAGKEEVLNVKDFETADEINEKL